MPRAFVILLCVLAAAAAARGSSSTDTPAPAAHDSPYARPLPFFYDLYTFRGQTGGTAVIAAFAVPAGKLEREQGERGVRYRFDVTLVLADTALRSVSRTDDSVFVPLNRPLTDEHLLYTHIEVQAPPSGNTLQRVIMTDATQPGIGQLYTSHFPIPDYSGTELMLSDIALGQPDAKSGWKRGDVTLALLPTSQFPSSAFDVYYEIYNLPARHRYVTEITVQEAGFGGAQRMTTFPVTIRFNGESPVADDAAVAELRRVETSLGRGRYQIKVTVTDEVTGKSATRSRVFEVHRSGRAATMVPALPRIGNPRR